MKLTSHVIFIKTSIFMLAFILSASPAFARSSLQECSHEDCLRARILDHPIREYSIQDCKVLENKYSDSVYEENLQMLCHLFIARDKAGRRGKQACINEKAINPDYDIGLSDIPLWLYSDVLYRSLPKKIKPVLELRVDSYNNSTAYSTYALTRSGIIKNKNSYRKYKFDVYVCKSRYNKRYYYIPYYYALGMTEPIFKDQLIYHFKYLALKYLAQPPLKEFSIVQQLPKQGMDVRHDTYALIDFDSDGSRDYVFVDASIPRYYRPGLCLYQQQAPFCKVVIAADYAESNIMQRIFRMEVKPKESIILHVKDKYGEQGSEQFKYRFKNGGLVLSQ